AGPAGEVPVGSVRAVTVITEVIGVPELVMNALVPSTTHSPVEESRRARVRVAPASLPASGSVNPKAASASPAHSGGSHRLRCSSVPNMKIGLAPSPAPAGSVVAMDEATRPSSSTATQNVVNSAPDPP